MAGTLATYSASNRLSRQSRATSHGLTHQVQALKHALNSARNEHSEASQARLDSRAGVLPSRLSLSQEAKRLGGEDDVAEVDTPAPTILREPPVLGGRQSIRHDHLETHPIFAIEIQEDHVGTPSDRYTRNDARGESAGRAEARTVASNNGGQLNDASVLRDINAVSDTCGTREAAPGSPPGDALAAEASQVPPSEQMVQQMPQRHPKLLPEKLSPRTGRAEVCRLGRDLEQARATADEATESRREAEGRVAELEEVIAQSERQHALFRERGEARLETLKLAFAQEQEEGGAHVRTVYVGAVTFDPRTLHWGVLSVAVHQSTRT